MSVERVIEAVDVDSNRPNSGRAASQVQQFQQASQQIASETNPQGSSWHLGNAASQVVTWAVQALAKAGTLSIIGVSTKTSILPLEDGDQQEPDS